MIATALAASAPANAAFSLVNTNGGDGYVVGTNTNFDLFGSDDGTPDNYTAFLDTAAIAQTYKATFTYTTNDCCGSLFDPAGLFLGSHTNSLYQLSPLTSAPGASVTGTVRFRVGAGENYGFYVYTAESVLGRGDIAVNLATDVPEPATWMLLLTGFAIAGVGLRRRTAALARAV